MRVGLIADIHGNRLPLEAVLRRIDAEQVDAIVCLGDVAVLGPDPAGVVATLRARGIPSVLGNTDAWLSGARFGDAIFAELIEWTRDQLSAADRDFIAAFPMTARLEVGGDTLVLAHGSPRSYNDVVSALTPDDELTRLLGDPAPALFANGHTHVQLLRSFGAGSLINPGSVGLPGIGPGTPDLPQHRDVAWAEFAILDRGSDGAASVRFHRIPLDLADLFEAARASGMPHFDWWRTLWRG